MAEKVNILQAYILPYAYLYNTRILLDLCPYAPNLHSHAHKYIHREINDRCRLQECSTLGHNEYLVINSASGADHGQDSFSNKML